MKKGMVYSMMAIFSLMLFFSSCVVAPRGYGYYGMPRPGVYYGYNYGPRYRPFYGHPNYGRPHYRSRGGYRY